MKTVKTTTILLLVTCLLALATTRACANDKSDIEVLEISAEPIRQGRNVVRAKLRNRSSDDQAFSLDVRTESATGNWQTQFPHVIQGGKTQWIRRAYRINGPITDGLRIRLRFYTAGPETDANGRKVKHYFKEIIYSGADLEHAGPDEGESEPATQGQQQTVTGTLRNFQDRIDNKDYEAAWQLLSQDFRDAQLFDKLRIFEKSMDTPYFLFPLSRADVLALEPRSACRRKGVLALTTALKDECWKVGFTKRGDRWCIDSFGRTNAAPTKAIPIDPGIQEQALRQAFAQWQNSIRDGDYKAAWGLLTSGFRRSRQHENDFHRFAREMGSEGNMMRAICLGLRPESVTSMRMGESAILNVEHAGQPYKIGFLMEDGQWKIHEMGRGRDSGGDWQARLLPKMQKRSTKHFDIFCFEDSTAQKDIAKIAEQRDRGFSEICRFLGNDSDLRIRMILFEDGASKYSHTGHQGAGWAFGNTVVEIYNEKQRLDPYHETTHVLMRAYGSPPALFNEGFATYMSERLGSQALAAMKGGEASIYERVRDLDGKGELIELKELLTYTEIGSRQSNPPVAYPEAASFVKFLIDTYDKDRFLKAYRTLRNSSDKSVQAQNVEALQKIYSKSLEELIKEWKAVFGRASVNASRLPSKPHLSARPGSTVPPAQAEAVIRAFEEYQACLKDEKYAQAWALTTQYMKDVAMRGGGGVEKFKEMVVRLDMAAVTAPSASVNCMDFLEGCGVQVALRVTGGWAGDRETYYCFVEENGQWKLNKAYDP